MEEIVRLAVKPIAFFGMAVITVGLIYLGLQLRDGLAGGGGETRKALALIVAGGVVVGFASLYGFTKL
ncbi:hypothetical protein [Arcanobacterium hippocoleae]|uniref:Uncharacterized protein n=1 Tax=Arcanobacterium hippocoleae TaxID=149017 RepID=A0ABU1T1J5_9ACTO|nr:hypothetical protein [Arcanobacterium hippocoleae]MDR6939242.1 hypothetical protein [Arcanobacterium hippocoleae]